MMTLRANSLTAAGYRGYGDVIGPRADLAPTKANLGTADRFNFLARVENLRPGAAEPNLCVFRCDPMIQAGEAAFEVRLLERHPFSTQAFIPMQGAGRFLVIACLGGEAPDLTTLCAFVADGDLGITYRPGVWHHPLVVMAQQSTFACLVWEDGLAGDCETVALDPGVMVVLPPLGSPGG